MDLIDRDYLLDNIVEWRAMLTDEKEKKLLTEVMHCIKAKDTIVDMQKLIDGVNSQKIDLDSTESDIKAASVYNSAIDDSLYEVVVSGFLSASSVLYDTQSFFLSVLSDVF